MAFQRVPPERYPWWVRFTLLAGGRTRRGQQLYIVASIIAAVVCAALLAMLNPRPITALSLGVGAVGFVLSAAWYALSIGWIDRNGSWSDLKR